MKPAEIAWVCRVLVLALVVVGCSAELEPWRPMGALAVTTSPACTAAELGALGRAVGAWEAYVGPMEIHEAPSSSAGTVWIDCEGRAPGAVARTWRKSDRAVIALDRAAVLDAAAADFVRDRSADVAAAALEHEIGHVLCLGHSHDSSSVMLARRVPWDAGRIAPEDAAAARECLGLPP